MMARSKPKAVEYKSLTARLTYEVVDDKARLRKPDSDPTFELYRPGEETALETGTMSAVGPTREITLLDYDTQTAEFEVNDLVTGASGASGRILDDVRLGASGRLVLTDVDGTFADDEALTSAKGGAAVANGAGYSNVYELTFDASDDVWTVAEDYPAKVEFSVDGRGYVAWFYFDVAFFPMIEPIVNEADVNREHPLWIRERPKAWGSWSWPIAQAHSELVNRIRSHGEQAHKYVRRQTEFWDILMAFVSKRIAISLNLPDRQQWAERAEEAWLARGELTVSDDGDQDVDGSEVFYIERVR
jgi:hypothetical protein